MTEQFIQLDPDYKLLLQALKEKVKRARMQAMLAVNKEQIQLYWEIGHLIIERQKESVWGSKLLEQISNDLKKEFGGMKGWSVANLEKMKQFANVYPSKKFPEQLVPELPWGHIIVLIQKVKDDVVRKWYAEQALFHGWARDALVRHIQSDLYSRQAVPTQKLTNFQQCLPAPQSDLAEELIKAPYDFRFLPGSQRLKERELEEKLIEDVRKFLLELGHGFAFIGNQYHLDVGGDDFYIDLLFFNIELNCYFVIELKRGKFKPESVGKLNFYLSVIDDTVKKPGHAQSIGLLLCENKNRVVAEYAINNLSTPMGISEYQLSQVLPPVELLEESLSHNEDVTLGEASE